MPECDSQFAIEKRSMGVLVQKRTVPILLLETFDLPDNSVSCGCHQQSLLAPPALALLNGDLMEAAAVALAERVGGVSDTSEQIRPSKFGYCINGRSSVYPVKRRSMPAKVSWRNET